jgi:hypothetical protein
MSEKENSSNANGGGSRQGLSKEAWVAISTIAAALITGIVTLIIHLAPQKPAAMTSATPAPTTTASSAPAQASTGVTADAIAGKWFGNATDKDGVTFEVRLQVRKGCAINEKCGSMSVSNTPCYGYISLERAHDPIFEFNVDNFYGESDPEKCHPGPGEEFQLTPEGKLEYRSTYEPRAQGTLERIKD